MKQIILAAVLLAISCVVFATPPSEQLVRSCLQDRAAASSIVVHNLDTTKVIEEDDYSDGFNTPYYFKYKGGDVGYAERKDSRALIFMGKLYRLSSAISLGDNRGPPTDFTPSLADWSIVTEGAQKYLCVSFNFDGLGQSGDFQNVHGGYLLNTMTKELYFVVRDIR
ncbi:hypothetical protein [Dyella psychrodurans]|uniref:Uncharacterized protein n=1 Tax=Dyella psychrodurans TaxID=1927960 RepID=A0A370WVH6_9GAMM|nr:hypothetical protein [Dyella psychrodurans]RDS80017.1 hypothetical protein DWU99_20395 [Dyella psychrodurans]